MVAWSSTNCSQILIILIFVRVVVHHVAFAEELRATLDYADTDTVDSNADEDLDRAKRQTTNNYNNYNNYDSGNGFGFGINCPFKRYFSRLGFGTGGYFNNYNNNNIRNLNNFRQRNLYRRNGFQYRTPGGQYFGNLRSNNSVSTFASSSSVNGSARQVAGFSFNNGPFTITQNKTNG